MFLTLQGKFVLMYIQISMHTPHAYMGVVKNTYKHF